MKLAKHLILLFYIGFIACQKPGPGMKGPNCGEPQNYYNPSAELVSASFHEGTFWIYLDSVSLTYDSALVTQFSDALSKTHPEGCDNFQQIHYRIMHWPSGPEEDFYVFFSGIKKEPTCYDCGVKVYIPFGTNEDEPSKYSRTYYDSLFVYDRYYKKVEKSTVNDDPTESHNKVVYYMNSEIGFLRKDVFYSNNSLLSKKLLVRKNMVK